jgi:hypothetical protein
MLDSAPIGIHADNYFGAPEFFVTADARRRHMALFGGTGTGKSTLLTNMAACDLESGSGVTVVDPHGGLCDDLLTHHIPRRRKHDVIYFDPKNQQHALALNILDCPSREQRGLVVSHVVSIFHTLWVDSWGARLEDLLRNALWALIEQPSPSSLLALPKLLTDEKYRADMLRHLENPAVLDFFSNTFARWTPSFREEAISPVLNKCRKILLCDLAKGSIGDDNSRLLGSLIVLKEKLAALSRQDIPESARVPHVLVCEEAHNFIGDFESILAEARKYGLILTLATQGIEALPHEASFAIFSNCATVISFRVSGTDAARLENEFGMVLPASSLQDLPDYMMFVRTLARKDGASAPSGPHRVSGHPPFKPHSRPAFRESVIRVSRERYANPRSIVDEQLKREFFDTD